MAFLALIIIIELEGMHFGHFWPPGPLGSVRGGKGAGGSDGPGGSKFSPFRGATLGFQNVEFRIV